MFPDRFNNKTNGVTPRRWLLLANPDLARLLTEAVGDGWVTDLGELKQIAPLADDAAFREKFLAAKRAAKVRFVDWIKASRASRSTPTRSSTRQIKRIHEYKRQLLNVLQIVVCYNRLRANPALDLPPRTYLFAGKAAPAYRLAKLIIKLINDVGSVVNNDPDVRGKLRVVFLPNYSVTLAERLIPASDVSEQISTAGYEASGTSNMKFMMNGALTVGTRDGATIEIAEEAGEENVFLFGLTAEQVAGSRGWYDPRWHYEHEDETRRALDLIFSGHFNRGEPGLYDPIRDALLDRGDYYMHLADLASYVSTQSRVSDLYADRRRMGPQGHPQRRPVREVLERPDDRGVCGIDLGGDALSRRPGRGIPVARSRVMERDCMPTPRPAGEDSIMPDWLESVGDARVDRPGGGPGVGRDLGLLPQGRGGADAAAPGGLRRRGPADDRPRSWPSRSGRRGPSRRSPSVPGCAGSSRRSTSRRAATSRRASSCSSSTRSPSRPSSPRPRRSWSRPRPP